MNAKTSSKPTNLRRLTVLIVVILAFGALMLCSACSSTESTSSSRAGSEESGDNQIDEPVTDESSSTNAATGAGSGSDQTTNQSNAGKTLVAYFSGTGTTARVAQMIAAATGGELYEIEAAQPYTEDELSSDGYYGDNRPYNESQDNSIRPEIASQSVVDPASYTRVFLGYPIWYGTVPDIIYTFLDRNDFGHTPIYPFCTSGSSGIEGSVDLLKSLYPSLNWMSGDRFSSSTTQEEVDEWVHSLPSTREL